jgi:tight adherence protein B
VTVTHPLFLAAGLALCFGSIAVLVLITFRSSRGQIALSRRRPGVVAGPSLLTRATDTATAYLERNVSRNAAFGSRASLEQAGLKMRQADFILLVACIAVTAGVVGFILYGFIAALLMTASTPLLAKLTLNVLSGRRRSQFDAQLGDTLQMLAGGLRAGHSLMRSVDAVARDADAPTSEEFARLVNESRLGRDLQESMQDAAVRMRSEDFSWIGQAIEIHREVGGDLAEVLDQVGETIRERSQIKGQVKALSAEGRLSAYILIALPVGMFLYMSIASSAYISTLYTTTIGWVLIGVAAVLLAVGSFWLSRVVKIKF